MLACGRYDCEWTATRFVVLDSAARPVGVEDPVAEEARPCRVCGVLGTCGRRLAPRMAVRLGTVRVRPRSGVQRLRDPDQRRLHASGHAQEAARTSSFSMGAETEWAEAR